MKELVADVLRTIGSTCGVPRRYPAGSLLFAEGDRGTEVLLIRQGTVRVITGGGEPIIEIGPGGILGEFAAIDGLPRSASAIAITDVELAAVDAVSALQALATAPAVDLEALRANVNVVRRVTERRAVDSGGLPVAALASHLVARIDGEPGAVQTLGPGPLAAQLGVSLELMARALDHLHHSEVISVVRGTVVVHDVDALRQLASR